MSVVSIMMGSDKDIDFANIMIQEFNALNIDTKVYVSSAHKNTMQVLYNIGEMDKSKKFGLNVPKGTWMVSMKVDDKEIWDNYVKNDKVFGFSLEGRFADILVAENVEQNFSDQRIDNALENIKQLLINHFKE